MIQHGGHEINLDCLFNYYSSSSSTTTTTTGLINPMTINQCDTVLSTSSSQSTQPVSVSPPPPSSSSSSLLLSVNNNQSTLTSPSLKSYSLPQAPCLSYSSSPSSSNNNNNANHQRKLTNFTIESILNNIVVKKCNSISFSSSSPSSSTTTAKIGLSRNRKCIKFCHRIQLNDSSNGSNNNGKSTNPNNRGPRIPFTSYQVQLLERKFSQTNYLSSYEVWSLSEQLNISENRVKIWFQNRRARRKREERLPDEINSQLTEENLLITNSDTNSMATSSSSSFSSSSSSS